MSQLPKKFRRNGRLYRNGYRIYTTINTVYQEAAQKTVTPYLRELSKRNRRPPFRNIEVFDEEFNDMNQMAYSLFDLNQFVSRQNKQERDFQREFTYAIREELQLLSLASGNSNLARAIDFQMQNEQELGVLQNIEGALISIVPNSGEIAAVIGGSEYSSGNRQLRFQSIRRQSGSAFKPLIVAAALQLTADRIEQGLLPITAASLFEDTPLHFINEDLSEFSPDNYSKEYEGKMTLRRALTRSKNSIAIQLYQRAGIPAVNRIVEKMLHLEEDSLPEDFTIPLGTLGVSPLQMARIFASFANGGWEYPPYLIERIERASSGEVLYTATKQVPIKVLDREVTEILTAMMSDVISQGTGKLARLVGRDTAGKTGTTNNNTNAWFAGYTKQLTTVVYLGYDLPRSMGAGATGGGYAAPLWGRYMLRALRYTPNIRFAYPDSQVKAIQICAQTGSPSSSSDNCPDVITELFLPGTFPEDASDNPTPLFPGGDATSDPNEKDFFSLEDFE